MSSALLPQPPQFPMRPPRVFLLRRRYPHHRPHSTLASAVANQHCQQLVAVQPVGLGAPRAAIDFNARRIHYDVVDTVFDEPAVQPEAVPPGLIAAAHARLRRQPATRLGLGDALEQRRGVPCRHRIAARAAHPVAQRQLPMLLTQFEGHVQLARFYRMLSLKGLYAFLIGCRFDDDEELWTTVRLAALPGYPSRPHRRRRT